MLLSKIQTKKIVRRHSKLVGKLQKLAALRRPQNPDNDI